MTIVPKIEQIKPFCAVQLTNKSLCQLNNIYYQVYEGAFIIISLFIDTVQLVFPVWEVFVYGIDNTRLLSEWSVELIDDNWPSRI